MKVIYDVSKFGEVLRDPKQTTGIYRVIDDLARALIKSGKCSLNFSATESEWHHSAIEFIKNSPDFKKVDFPHSALWHHAVAQYPKVDQRVAAATGLPKLLWRAARKTLYRPAHPRNPEFIQEESLNRANIFHSTFFAIPEQAPGPEKFEHIFDCL